MSCACGCCIAPVVVPAEIRNRPGLSALAYRIGTFSTFRKAIVDALTHEPALRRLESRLPDDYTITAIELWSAVADILTFYQERTANEAFLRTAVQRDSVLRLVRLLGYELRPGVAATTWLAFTAEQGATARIPARTRVKSVPVHDEPSVTYETLEFLEADAAWNALTPTRTRRRVLKDGDASAEFEGLGTRLAPGDLLAFVGRAKREHSQSEEWDVVRVARVRPDTERRVTHVTWTPGLGRSGRPFPKNSEVFALRQRAVIFGHDAPDWLILSDVAKAGLLGLASPDLLNAEDRREWQDFDIYAPDDTPRNPVSVGTITIEPTAQSVADAALAAAKQANQAVIGGAFAAAGRAVADAGKTVSMASEATSEMFGKVFEAASTNAAAAVSAFTDMESRVGDIATSIGDVGTSIAGIDPTNIDLGPLADAVDGLAQSSSDLAGSAFDAGIALLAFPAKAFEDLQNELLIPGAHVHPSDTVGRKVRDLMDQVGVAIESGSGAVREGASAAGAMATDQIVRIAVKTVMEARDPLPEPTPEYVALAARLAVGIAVLLISREATVIASGEGATMVSAAALIALGTMVVTPAVGALAVALIAVLAPVLAAAALVAILLAPDAHLGAERVAADVETAVSMALIPQHPPAPPRFQPRSHDLDRIDLDRVYPRVVRNGWLLLSAPGIEELYRVTAVGQTTRTDYALTRTVTRVKLRGNRLHRDPATGLSRFGIRRTAVFAESERLTLAPELITERITGATFRVNDEVAMPPGRRLLVAGTDDAGAPATDLVTLVSATPGAGETTLKVEPPLANVYRREDLAVYGNVASSSHGETVRNEIVGDGDAARMFQRFTLKKKPLTHVPMVPAGLESALELFVGGVLWKKAPTLYGASPRDEIYVTRIADDGRTTLEFGDGITGARLLTGRQNVVARYRQGAGLVGRVDARRLTTLLDRPTGLKKVTNPMAADGGADPETREQARQTAPGTVRTFGRAISLRDFEDTALTGGIVAKASATWVWTGERRAVHLTVAAQEGAPLSLDGRVRILAMLDAARDTNHTLLLANHVPVAFLLQGTITVDDRHVQEKVLASARAAVLDAFAFERRGFAEPVNLSDVYRILQDVEGVEFADLDVLDLKSRDAAFRRAHGVDDTQPQPQTRLLMLPARLERASRSVLPAELAWIEDPVADLTLAARGGLEA